MTPWFPPLGRSGWVVDGDVDVGDDRFCPACNQSIGQRCHSPAAMSPCRRTPILPTRKSTTSGMTRSEKPDFPRGQTGRSSIAEAAIRARMRRVFRMRRIKNIYTIRITHDMLESCYALLYTISCFFLNICYVTYFISIIELPRCFYGTIIKCDDLVFHFPCLIFAFIFIFCIYQLKFFFEAYVNFFCIEHYKELFTFFPLVPFRCCEIRCEFFSKVLGGQSNVLSLSFQSWLDLDVKLERRWGIGWYPEQ